MVSFLTFYRIRHHLKENAAHGILFTRLFLSTKDAVVGGAASNFGWEPLLPFLVFELIFQSFDPMANGFRFVDILLFTI